MFTHVQHKTKPDVYGYIAKQEEGLLLVREKWHKFKNSIQRDWKIVDESIWYTFKAITPLEYIWIESLDMNNSK